MHLYRKNGAVKTISWHLCFNYSTWFSFEIKKKRHLKLLRINKFKRKKLKNILLQLPIYCCVCWVWICICTEVRGQLVVVSSLLSLCRWGIELGWRFVYFKLSFNILKIFFCPGCCIFVVRLSCLLIAPNNDTDTY